MEIPSRHEVLERIEALAAAFVDCVQEGKAMDMETLRRTLDAMAYDEAAERLIHNQETRLLRFNRSGARKYTAVWLVLQTAHELLTDNKTVTQREFYYMHPFFKCQTEADEAIIDAGCILRIPRSSLHIFGATKGCFSGCLSIHRDTGWRSYDDGDEHPITQQLLQLERDTIQSHATCIVVIEKDGIFNRLREDNFSRRLPCILVTGRGFPDLSTRIFVSLLSQLLQIPVFGLSDCNPFGLSIMLTYRIGSARMPLDSQPYSIDIRWIGLRPSSVNQLQLPPGATKPLSTTDMSKASALMKSQFVQSKPEYQKELELWTSRQVPFKVELEGLHTLGFDFLATFVENCIDRRDCI